MINDKSLKEHYVHHIYQCVYFASHSGHMVQPHSYTPQRTIFRVIPTRAIIIIVLVHWRYWYNGMHTWTHLSEPPER